MDGDGVHIQSRAQCIDCVVSALSVVVCEWIVAYMKMVSLNPFSLCSMCNTLCFCGWTRSIKRVLKWTNSEHRWTKVCRSGTLKILHNEMTGKMMVVIKQRAGDQMLHFSHVLPDAEDAHFKCNQHKLSCQWLVERDFVQKEQDFTVFVYFRTLEAFRGFVHSFETSRR